MGPLSILHTEWSDGWGGQEVRTLSECLGMAQRGHRVAIAGAPTGRLGERARAAGLGFVPLAMRGPGDLGALRRLLGVMRERAVEVVQTHSSVDSWVGGMAARLSGRLLVRCRHLSAPVHAHALNFVWRLPHGFVTTGSGIRRHLLEALGVDEARVVSIPTGVDVERFAPGPGDMGLKAELGLEPAAPVVAMVAVLRSWKRHDIFLAMARRVLERRPGARFLIVGEGPYRAQVEAKVAELGLSDRVVMTGHREDVERILPICDVVVLASDKNEGVSQSVLQALSAGRAVAGAAAGDTPEIVRDGVTGLLAPPGEAEPLAAAVERLLDDPDLRARLGEAGRAMVVGEYSFAAMLERTEAFYQLLQARRGP